MSDPNKRFSLVALSKLNHWARNYKTGDIDAIAASISAWGFNGALRVWSGQVMAGNQSLTALQRLKASGATAPIGIAAKGAEWLVPCLDISHLGEQDAKKFAVADNRTHELGEDDKQALAQLLKEFSADGGLLGTGYTDNDLAALLKKTARVTTPASNQPITVQYAVLIECVDEPAQVQLLERLTKEGLSCRALTS